MRPFGVHFLHLLSPATPSLLASSGSSISLPPLAGPLSSFESATSSLREATIRSQLLAAPRVPSSLINSRLPVFSGSAPSLEERVNSPIPLP